MVKEQFHRYGVGDFFFDCTVTTVAAFTEVPYVLESKRDMAVTSIPKPLLVHTWIPCPNTSIKYDFMVVSVVESLVPGSFWFGMY